MLEEISQLLSLTNKDQKQKKGKKIIRSKVSRFK